MGFKTYHHHDVLFGRGHKFNVHPGNIYYRTLVKKLKPIYFASSERDNKSLFARLIVGQIQGLNPPGRYLKKSEKTGLWEDVGSLGALDKTRRGLYDNRTKQETVEKCLKKKEICQLVAKYAREVYEELSHGDISKQTFSFQLSRLGFLDLDDMPTTYFKGLEGLQVAHEYDNPNTDARNIERSVNVSSEGDLRTEKTLKMQLSDFQVNGNNESSNNSVFNPNLSFQAGQNFDYNSRAYNNDLLLLQNQFKSKSCKDVCDRHGYGKKTETVVSSPSNQRLHSYDCKSNWGVGVSSHLLRWESDMPYNIISNNGSIHINDNYNHIPPLLTNRTDYFHETTSTTLNTSIMTHDQMNELKLSTLTQDPTRSSFMSSGKRSSIDSHDDMNNQITKLYVEYGFENPSDFSEFRMSLDEGYREEFDELMESVMSNEYIDNDMLRDLSQSIPSTDSSRTSISINSGPKMDDFQRHLRTLFPSKRAGSIQKLNEDNKSRFLNDDCNIPVDKEEKHDDNNYLSEQNSGINI